MYDVAGRYVLVSGFNVSFAPDFPKELPQDFFLLIGLGLRRGLHGA
jgi:hypothetical protein